MKKLAAMAPAGISNNRFIIAHNGVAIHSYAPLALTLHFIKRQSLVMSGENFYHMLVMLEEPLDDTSENEGKRAHEFVDELVLPLALDDEDKLNKWFDMFDQEICVPNEGHIKYEITSDGIIVLILDKDMEPLVAEVRSFVEKHGPVGETD